MSTPDLLSEGDRCPGRYCGESPFRTAAVATPMVAVSREPPILSIASRRQYDLRSMSAPALAGRPSLRIRGTQYPVLLPTLRDPRLHLAAVIVTLQVLGQVAFDFQLSIAQILVSLIVAGVLEFGDHVPDAARAHVARERAPDRQRRRLRPARAGHASTATGGA